MKILLIVAHPNPLSFNHAIAAACRDSLAGLGHVVIFHDLYAEGFDPLLKAGEAARDAELDEVVRQHVDDLVAADGVVFVHPNWWGMPPAILTGWIDRVVRAGVAYKFVVGDNGEGVPVGLLKARTFVVFNTSNTEARREAVVFGDPLELIWKNCVCGLCQIADFERKAFRIVVTSDDITRKAWLAEAREIVARKFPAISR